ncbi:MAG: hypothetical protein ACR2KK_03010 [Acidimicrobiales bacterium]
MNEPEDRPPPSDRPAPYGAPPDAQAEPPAAGGPPAEPVESIEASIPAVTPPRAEPEARGDDVVDPAPPSPPLPPDEPEPPAGGWPAPNRVRPTSTAPARTSQPQDVLDDDMADDGYDDYDDEPASRWVSLLATMGTALIGIVTVQVLASLVEGLTLKSGARVGVPDDLFHRLGYPFGGLGATALVFLVVGVVLVSMPSVLDELLSESQDRVVSVALLVATVMGVLIAIGSLLAVRANLHEYAAKNVAVPSYVRVQFTNFLLGSLGAAALALFGSITSMNERSRERL